MLMKHYYQNDEELKDEKKKEKEAENKWNKLSYFFLRYGKEEFRH